MGDAMGGIVYETVDVTLEEAVVEVVDQVTTDVSHESTDDAMDVEVDEVAARDLMDKSDGVCE